MSRKSSAIALILILLTVACAENPVAPESPDPTPIPTNPLPAEPKPEPAPTPTPDPPTPPPEPSPSRPDRPHWYGRPMHVGWFFRDSNPLQGYRSGGACDRGTIDIAADSAVIPIIATSDAPFGGKPSYLLHDVGRLTYVWAAANAQGRFNESDYQAARAFSRANGVPMLLYYDGRDRWAQGAVHGRLEGRDVFGMNGYPAPGDTVDSLIASIRERLADMPSTSVAFVRAVDNRNGSQSEAFMESTQVPITRTIREHDNVVMDLLFACARPNGALDFQRLLQHGNELADAARRGL